jgi:hypothetical protein
MRLKRQLRLAKGLVLSLGLDMDLTGKQRSHDHDPN